MKSPVEVTKQAIYTIKAILKNKEIPKEYSLRIATKGRGCAVGFKLGFDKKKKTDDEYFVDGVSILIQKNELIFLAGKKIDYYDESDGKGFIFL